MSQNYLPPEEIDRATPLNHIDPTRRQAVGAFRRLGPDQRAHYYMKAGFAGDEARLATGGQDAAQRGAVEALFAGVTAADRAALADGFGRDIAELFVPAPHRGRPGISEAARRRDGQEAEMVPLFRDILRSL